MQLLMAALTKTHTEIDDHVTYMRRPVKVWLSEMWDEKARKGTALPSPSPACNTTQASRLLVHRHVCAIPIRVSHRHPFTTHTHIRSCVSADNPPPEEGGEVEGAAAAAEGEAKK